MSWQSFFRDRLKLFAKKDGSFAQDINDHGYPHEALVNFLEESIMVYSDTFQDAEDPQRRNRLVISREIMQYLNEHEAHQEGTYISPQTRRLLEQLDDVKREDGTAYYYNTRDEEYFVKRLAKYWSTVEFLRDNVRVNLRLKLRENEDGIAGLREMPKLSKGQTKKLKELREEHTRLILARVRDESSLRHFESIEADEISLQARFNRKKAAEDEWDKRYNGSKERDEPVRREPVSSGGDRTWEQFSAPRMSRGESELDVEVALAERPGIPYSSNRYVPDGLALSWFAHMAGLTHAPTQLTWTAGAPTTRAKCVRVLRQFAPDKHPDASEDEIRKLGIVYAFYKTIVDYYDEKFIPEPIQALFKVLDAMHERVTTLEAKIFNL